jgi:purine-binding chemotaxis protein CheW
MQDDNKLPGSGGEFLTFSLGDEVYGIDILMVQEIRAYEVATKIANAPDHLKGVINLRGAIVPIVDMRVKFRMANVEYNEFTVVIILNVRDQVIGMVVDSVSDVIALMPEQIHPAPPLGNSIDTQYLIGMGTTDDRMIILIDIERLMSSDELDLLNTVAT